MLIPCIGWLAGHLLETSYAADWGDYTSFIEHIKTMADEKGVDVIVVDDGDQHDGNGSALLTRQVKLLSC